MARRVGFGEERRETLLDRAGLGAEPPEAAETAPASNAAETPGEARKAGPVARIVIVLFLMVWLALWSFGIHEAWDAATELYEQSSWEILDYALLGFFGIWLTGALIGWAFGVVLLVIMLFGKEVKRSPEEQAARWKRKLGRSRAKDDA